MFTHLDVSKVCSHTRDVEFDSRPLCTVNSFMDNEKKWEVRKEEGLGAQTIILRSDIMILYDGLCSESTTKGNDKVPKPTTKDLKKRQYGNKL